ncbi:restriction endonuclease [Ramlibacter henchirensis]|nr:restriction endonuclease [Ramlibacter henchirensis]
MARKSRGRHFSDTLLGTAVTLFGLGILLLLIRSMLGDSSSEMLQAVIKGVSAPAPVVLLAGLVLGAVGFALKPRASLARRAAEPTFFPADSTDFIGTMTPPAEFEEAPPHRGERQPPRAWGAQVFQDIEWRRFESLCSRLFTQAGFDVRPQSHGPEGGVDIWLHSRSAQGPIGVVQCKHWRVRPVGVQQLREFVSLMASHNLARGTYITTSTFTADALRFARERGIDTLDGEGLLQLIAQRSSEQQQSLLAHAYEGEYWRPTCGSCGLKMVEVSPRTGGAGFWGCADLPRCRFTLPVVPQA